MFPFRRKGEEPRRSARAGVWGLLNDVASVPVHLPIFHYNVAPLRKVVQVLVVFRDDYISDVSGHLPEQNRAFKMSS